MNIEPIGDQLLVTPSDVSDRLDCGLYVPQTAEGREPKRVTVVSAGPGRITEAGHLIPCAVGPGDEVILSPYNSAVEVRVAGRPHLLVRANDVIGRVHT